MTKNKLLTLIALFLLVFYGCRKDVEEKYARPDWLAGKLYTQILEQPELSTFAELLKISGYDTIIDVSGSYTVFAPSNEAFNLYFQNSQYKSVAQMPKSEVMELVKFHLVQNPWTKKQLQQLDIYGWIDTLDLRNNLPRGYKRETLLLEKNPKFGVVYSTYLKQNSKLKRTNLIDSTATSWNRKVFADSRKFSPIFFKDYFDIYDLTPSDYEFYYGRPFTVGDIFYSNGKIVSNEIFAENGFVYTIDRVAQPLRNGQEILSDKSQANQYISYLNLVNQFAEMEYNEQETNRQPGADQGLKVDSLFNLRYPQLVFDIHSERTKPPRGVFGLPSNVTIRYHHGIIAPTNEALNQLINQYIAGPNNWGSLQGSPENIKRIIANSGLSINPIYLTDVRKGFQNGENDIIEVDESSIVQKEYGSNCTFIGVNKPVVPRAFSSVTGPVYTRKGFSRSMFAIEASGLLSALKRKGANYSFYVESDANCSLDSSFIQDGNRFYAIMLAPSVRQVSFTTEDLRLLFLNHVGTEVPKGIARKEFIRNLAGNYIIVNNVTKEVKGSALTTYGYRGNRIVNVIPRQISTNADNGVTYEIDNWFDFSANSIFNQISANFVKFHALMKKAGLSDDKLSRYTFISDNQTYTALIPSDSVLNTINTDAMSTAQLRNFVLTHFIQGDMIFTDGKRPSGYYETARIDESSTQFSTVYSQIRLVPGVDKITIPAKDGSTYLVVNESLKTNQITGRSVSTTGTEAFANIVSTGVVHEIKGVLYHDKLDTK
jgi:uncharacterized surface protein with fasciclin (FAS1) repeats